MRHTKSSKKWLKEHFSDIYVQMAQKMGYRSRAAFKLIEIQEKDKLIKPGMTVVDLGAAPGGWSQLLGKWVGKNGYIVAMDVLAMPALPGVHFIQGDFTDNDILALLHKTLESRPVDVIISDMSPNTSGISDVDQPRIMYLAETALLWATEILKPGGSFLVKVFQGAGFDAYLKGLRQHFKEVHIRKPKASRPRSREVYLVGKGYNKK